MTQQAPNTTRPDAGSPKLLRVMGLVDRALARVEAATLAVTCLALFAMMLLVFCDAVMRYAFNAPLELTWDIVTMYLMSSGLLLCLSDTMRRGGHITVDLFAHWLPRRAYHLTIGVALLLTVWVTTLIAREIAILTWESWSQNELTVGIYAWPVWPSKGIVAFSFALLTVRLVHVGLSQLVAGLTGNEAMAITIQHVEDQPQEEGV
jgi:TRAP-type mannitol/chloroaromatic compound transport system permease small subunit